MKSIFIKSAFISLLLFGCKHQAKQDVPDLPTPKALQDNSSKGYSTDFKRSYQDDLLETLYAELVDRSDELQEIEDELEKLRKTRSDSSNAFIKFDEKNKAYYNSGDQHVQLIKDSILKSRMGLLISNSQTNYSSKILKHNDLLALLNSKDINLNDLHTVLKIVKTLPLIEKFQKENIPGTKPIENVLKDIDKEVRKLDTLIKH
ncbi:MAG: hypothetical protein ABIT58_02230 [Ferruginibacter sp.]